MAKSFSEVYKMLEQPAETRTPEEIIAASLATLGIEVTDESS